MLSFAAGVMMGAEVSLVAGLPSAREPWAFLAGMALSETVGERVHTMTSGVAELLVPFFLAGIGMRLDPAVFAKGSTLLPAGTLLVAAVVSKLVGCGGRDAIFYAHEENPCGSG
jgi:hypothetical protein